MDAEVAEEDPMDAEVAEEDPMDADTVEGHVEDGRSKTDLIGHSGDSDSDSDSKWKSWQKSMFWYELPKLRDIPNYKELPYPWEEGEGKEKEEGAFFLKVKDLTWSDLPDEDRKRGRWDEQPRMGKSAVSTSCLETVLDAQQQSLCTSAEVPSVRMEMYKGDKEWKEWDEQPRMVNSAAASTLCLETVLDAQQQSLCTSAEVLSVRMEMHKCYEEGISYRRLFKSEANRHELSFHNAYDEPYMLYVIRCQQESSMRTYAHVFPELHESDPIISCKWVRPTTLEGDKQYLQFFPQLMEATKFGETKDHILAKAIVLARKSFKKMLRFQIDIAVEDCMELLKDEETIKQRYDLYYFAVSEIVLNNMEFKSVIKSIRDGDSGLPYGLTEFSSCTDLWDGHIAATVHYLVNYFRYKRECGMYMEWVCEKIDLEVAQIVCETVDDMVSSRCHLYVEFLRKKRRIAQELGLVISEEDIEQESVRTTDVPVKSEVVVKSFYGRTYQRRRKRESGHLK